MGHLELIPFISDGFNVYFPILVCVLCAATYFNLGQRCLSAIGFQRFIDAADDMTNDMVDEGRQLVNRGKLIVVWIRTCYFNSNIASGKLIFSMPMLI